MTHGGVIAQMPNGSRNARNTPASDGKPAGEQDEAEVEGEAPQGQNTVTGDFLVDSLTAQSLDLPPQAVRVRLRLHHLTWLQCP